MAFTNPTEHDVAERRKTTQRKQAEMDGFNAFSSRQHICPYKVKEGDGIDNETILFARWWSGFIRAQLIAQNDI